MNTNYKKYLDEYHKKISPERLNFLKGLTSLEISSRDLERIHKITNTCLKCGAYSEKNMEEQFSRMDKAKSPKWEFEILKDVYELERGESHQIFRELKNLIKEYKKSYTKKSNKVKSNVEST